MTSSLFWDQLGKIGKTIDGEERPQKGSMLGLATSCIDVKITLNISEQPRGARERGKNKIPIKTDQSETNQALRPRTMTMICPYGKKCKNIRGLKIHQARMKCQVELSQTQRAGIPSRETDFNFTTSARKKKIISISVDCWPTQVLVNLQNLTLISSVSSSEIV